MIALETRRFHDLKPWMRRFVAMDFRFDSLEARIPVMEKIAEFEVRLADCVAF